MTSLNDGLAHAISALGKPLIVLTGAAHLRVRGAFMPASASWRDHVTRILDGRVRALRGSPPHEIGYGTLGQQ